MTDCSWRVGVVVPAHDEEESIGACVTSVLRALESAAQEPWIVVVADACSDATEARAWAALRGVGEVVRCSAHAVGVARGRGTERLLERLGPHPRWQWLLNTDADTTVPLDWVRTQLEYASEGAVAVAGVVSVHSFEGHGPGAEAAFRETYALHPDGTHPHVHGANLGVRGDVYRAVGGWSELSLAEDHCIWNRIQSGGWHAVSTTRSVVTTSGRTFGRAPGGFADTLRRVCAEREYIDRSVA